MCIRDRTGTWNTKDRRDENGNWDQDNDTRLLPELKAIPMRGRKVIILFDSDIEDNISVDDAATDIGIGRASVEHGPTAAPSQASQTARKTVLMTSWFAMGLRPWRISWRPQRSKGGPCRLHCCNATVI